MYSFFYSLQALWQETETSVALGTLAQSSLLADESRSQLNAQLAAAVAANRWPVINLLEVRIDIRYDDYYYYYYCSLSRFALYCSRCSFWDWEFAGQVAHLLF
jgi:hypothetical protein